ncbi:hypothetical protein AAMO2058_000216100 [Amorphochlora amoebiformis]
MSARGLGGTQSLGRGEGTRWKRGGGMKDARDVEDFLFERIQSLESEYRRRVDTLNNQHNTRLSQLGNVILKAQSEISRDPIIAAMKNDPVSSQFVAARVNEILQAELQGEREKSHRDLLNEYSMMEAQVIRWKSEFQRLRDEIKKVRVERDEATKRYEACEQMAEGLKEEVSAAQDNMGKQSSELAEAKATISHLSRYSTEIESLKERLAASELRGQKAYRTAREELSNLSKKQVQDLQNQLIAKTKRVTVLSQGLEKTVAEYKLRVSKIKAVAEDKQRATAQKFQDILIVKDKALAKANQSLTDHIAKIKVLSEQIEGFRAEVNDSRKKLDKTREELEFARKEEKAARHDVEEFHKEKKRYEEKIKESERERIAFQRKYISLGERVEDVLKQEDMASLQARELLEVKHAGIKQELAAEKKARRHEHRAHKRAVKCMEGANAELRAMLANVKRKLRAQEKSMDGIQSESKRLKELERQIFQKEAIIIRLRSEQEVNRAQFISESVSASRVAQDKIKALERNMADEKQVMHQKYQAMLSRKVGYLEQKLEAAAEEMASKRRIEKELEEALRQIRKLSDNEFKSAPEQKRKRSAETQTRADETQDLVLELLAERERSERLSVELKAEKERARNLESSLHQSNEKLLESSQEERLTPPTPDPEMLEHLLKARDNIISLQDALETEKKNVRKLRESLRSKSQSEEEKASKLREALTTSKQKMTKLAAATSRAKAMEEQRLAIEQKLEELKAKEQGKDAEVNRLKNEALEMNSKLKELIAREREAEREAMNAIREKDKAIERMRSLEGQLHTVSMRLKKTEAEGMLHRELDKIYQAEAYKKEIVALRKKVIDLQHSGPPVSLSPTPLVGSGSNISLPSPINTTSLPMDSKELSLGDNEKSPRTRAHVNLQRGLEEIDRAVERARGVRSQARDVVQVSEASPSPPRRESMSRIRRPTPLAK